MDSITKPRDIAVSEILFSAITAHENWRTTERSAHPTDAPARCFARYHRGQFEGKFEALKYLALWGAESLKADAERGFDILKSLDEQYDTETGYKK